ncbi:hypothetical protein [Geodermatophilus sp. TF02-6]|uniref:aa3-type cytochrome oxidase subunit CtaJ n=1 Tax=Geodermatophilus sp. TF02-6 TaxID=2250575 RepID=UPI0018F42218|nr:hypothetical protein [Geodermatophilus sp. TF02-6]
MTVVETILVYAVAPLAVFLLLALLTLVPGRRRRPRYKPGQPWDHEPVWYAPHEAGSGHDSAHADGHGGARALTAGHGGAHALTAAPQATGRPHGGARGTW